ncbi:hypothetical protein A5753_21400 [Mycobacterium sp. 852002-51971_SCH5477799-a]|nr:hypothetical protein A5753_21400 [Mycobacterium sp. 852002-51971_SCH5477799-a]
MDTDCLSLDLLQIHSDWFTSFRIVRADGFDQGLCRSQQICVRFGARVFEVLFEGVPLSVGAGLLFHPARIYALITVRDEAFQTCVGIFDGARHRLADAFLRAEGDRCNNNRDWIHS